MQWPCEIPIGKLQGHNITRTFEDGIETCPPNPEEIEDYILMQFTGLKDKNGKEIYEGDVVCERNLSFPASDLKHTVSWKSGGFVYGEGSYGDPSAFAQLSQALLDYEGTVLEIVGNRYENPELLNS